MTGSSEASMTFQEEASHVAFLVVGMARSGTTVAQRLLSELAGVHVVPETHFWRHAAALSRSYRFPMSSQEAREALQWFATQPSARYLDFDPETVAAQLNEQSFAWDLFSALVEHLAPTADGRARLLGEKTPDHLRWSEQLLLANASLRVVGLVRDPREVFRSHLSVPWGIQDPDRFAEKWVNLSRQLRDIARVFPGRVLAERYEDLADEPEAFRSRAATLLGAREEVSGDVGASLFAAEEWWKTDALGEVQVRPPRWQDELEGSVVERIETVCQDEMRLWAYDVATAAASPPTPEALTAASEERRVAERIASTHLPVNQEWMDGEVVRSYAASASSLLAAEEKSRATQDRLMRQVLDAQREAEQRATERDSWRKRAEFLSVEEKRLRGWVDAEKLARLRADRRRIVAEARVRRLKARRWWRLGEALSEVRRAPWRPGGLRRLAEVVMRRQPLPSAPDLSALDGQMVALTGSSGVANAVDTGTVDSARALLRDGRYEDALERLAGLPDHVRATKAVAMLIRDCHIRMGELTNALRAIKAATRAAPDASLEAQARLIEGRLREMDPGWLPLVTLPPLPGGSPTSDRVLHVVKESLPFFERGYTIRSHSTFLAQRAAGFEPIAVTSLGFPRHYGFQEFPVHERIDGIEHFRLDLGPEYDLPKVPLDLQLEDHATMLGRLADELRPEIIQVGSGYRGYETALVGLAVAERLGVPFIYEFRSHLEHTWTGEIERSEVGEQYEGRRQQELRCLSEADGVITIAEAMRDELIELGVPAEKISVVPNVVDVERFAPREPKVSLQELYGLRDRKVVGYISNLGQREGIDNLVRAVGHLRAGGVNAAGLVVGEGPEADALADLVTELGLENSFVLTGHVPNEEIEDYYALIDVFVVPRIDDKAARLVTPLKPLEAMAMQRPVVAADLPALREIVTPGERGELFPPGDHEGLASVLGDLLADGDRRRELGRAGRLWVAEQRTISANALRYRRVLDGVRGS